jgi:hypothetical protein
VAEKVEILLHDFQVPWTAGCRSTKPTIPEIPIYIIARERQTNHLPVTRSLYPVLSQADAAELDAFVTSPLFNPPANTYISLAGFRSGYGDKRSM